MSRKQKRGPKQTARAKIRRLERLVRKLERENINLCAHVDSLQGQVKHAARATNEMAAHSRALEVAAHAQRLQNQGIQVFGGSRSNRIAVGIEIPPLKTKSLKS